jgi:hypothetical protein
MPVAGRDFFGIIENSIIQLDYIVFTIAIKEAFLPNAQIGIHNKSV